MTKKPKGKVLKATEVSARYDPGFLDTMDGRVEVVRALRQRLGALVNDMGGLAALSYQEQSVCKRIVHLERLIEKRELSLAHGGTIDEGSYLTAITTLASLFSKLGLKRRVKQIQLSDYLHTNPIPEPGRQDQDKPVAITRPPQPGGD